MVEEIKRFAYHFYKDDDLHGWGHIFRVQENAKRIHNQEGGDWNKIVAMIWLHDIGRASEKSLKQHHAIISSDLARKFLQKNLVKEQEIQEIIDGILSHSFSIGVKPITLEAKILSDADKLDAIGAVGIFRTSAYQHGNNSGIRGIIKHIDEKLLKLENLMLLKFSQYIAKERTQRILRFKNELLEEL